MDMLVEFEGVGVVWVSRMRLQTSTGVALINLHEVESVNIEDLNYDEDDKCCEMPRPSKKEEYEPEYAVNVCMRSGKEYEVLLPSREAAERVLNEIETHIGFMTQS